MSVSVSGNAALVEWRQSLSQILRGKPETVRLSLITLLAQGHLLIEDIPGVGKTTLAQGIAWSVGATMHRLQFTADLLPADLVGVSIFDPAKQEFQFKPGPVFAHFLVADEINRANPKAQSALLEAMNEGQVSVDGATHALPKPFMVLATQNPIDFQGTFPLPESQLDRFLMRISIGYPDRQAELEILSHRTLQQNSVKQLFTPDQILELQQAVLQVRFDESVAEYLLNLVDATRQQEQLQLGVSPRGSRALYRAAQASALLADRTFVIPEDVKDVFLPVCAHRVMVKGHGSRQVKSAERLLQTILDTVPTPR